MRDSDDSVPVYRRGPGRQCSGSGAVIEAYVDTDALDRPCAPPKGCGAGKGDFCRFPNGNYKHVPCVSRTVTKAVTA